MLPFEKQWYRKLLILAPVIGATAGVLALIFMRITGTASDFFFGGTDTGWWAGRWWWIPLTAFGGLIVSVLRKAWKIPKVVPGSVALAQQAWVDPSQALYWVAITTVSLITGASLGPSFGLVVLGGVVGSWLVTRLGIHDDEEAKQGYTLTGMAGGMGGGFSAPLFAAVLASELSPTSKRNYVAAFIPELFSSTIGFVIYFGVTGHSMLGSYKLPAYELSLKYLIIGVLLGVAAVCVLILFTLISKLVFTVMARINNPYVLGVAGGALVGLISFALPLAATSGSGQLATELQISETIGAGFIIAILIGKMFAIAISQSSGFLGGIVFPSIFLGGTAGLLVHSLFPSIPIALCVGAMLAATPGAFLSAPLALLIIAAGTVSIGAEALAPITISVVIAHLLMSLMRKYVLKEVLPQND
jgi:H+/Cl- antiporter ClcA